MPHTQRLLELPGNDEPAYTIKKLATKSSRIKVVKPRKVQDDVKKSHLSNSFLKKVQVGRALYKEEDDKM